MKTLLLRFVGPMQSWGTQSRYKIRETNLEPSKSGVIGLVYSALGKKREKEEIDEPNKPSLKKLASLRLGVRIDSAGSMLCDYHTAGGAPPHRQEKRMFLASGKLDKKTEISYRYYLSDAKFLIGLEGNEDLIELLHKNISSPKQQIFLGRKSFVPSEPVWLQDGLCNTSLENALKEFPSLNKKCCDQNGFLSVLETDPSDPESIVRNDVPISYLKRKFSVRYVKAKFLKMQKEEK